MGGRKDVDVESLCNSFATRRFPKAVSNIFERLSTTLHNDAFSPSKRRCM